MITSELLERALRSANKLRIDALQDFDEVDIIPDAAGVILILGDAVLPGYVSRIISGLKAGDQNELIRKLQEENPFVDANLATWIEREGETYPGMTAYALALDEVRRLAIDFVTQSQRQSSV